MRMSAWPSDKQPVVVAVVDSGFHRLQPMFTCHWAGVLKLARQLYEKLEEEGVVFSKVLTVVL